MPVNPNLSHEDIEEGGIFTLDFDKLNKVVACGESLVPVAVQDYVSKELLIIAYVNKVALEYSVENDVAAFWSTSRNELWIKGSTSGDMLELIEVRVNCEQNSLLYLVKPCGKGACHTKDAEGNTRDSCYYRSLSDGRLNFTQ